LSDRSLPTVQILREFWNDRKQVVRLSFFFQALQLRFNKKGFGPLDIGRNDFAPLNKSDNIIAYSISLPEDEMETELQARTYIEDCERSYADLGIEYYCAIFTPEFPGFPTFDGFISFKDSRQRLRFGFQVNPGKKVPSDSGLWLDEIFHLAGDPPVWVRKPSKNRSPALETPVTMTLGYSFQNLIPILYSE
jgi:hypothetical protein